MLGDLSAKYESNGNPGTISSGQGDAGGKSYGCYQLAMNGGLRAFLQWLKDIGHTYGQSLANLAPGTQDFDALWRNIAEVDGENFKELQHEYIKDAYYEPAVFLLSKAYFNIEKHSEVMQDVVWSRAVQYGAGNIVEMFETAARSLGHPNLSYVDDNYFDAAMISAIYLNVCKTPEWTNGSPTLREGLYSRFDHECAEALSSL